MVQRDREEVVVEKVVVVRGKKTEKEKDLHSKKTVVECGSIIQKNILSSLSHAGTGTTTTTRKREREEGRSVRSQCTHQ